MSAFALPIPPERVTPSPSQAYGTLRYRSVLRRQSSVVRGGAAWGDMVSQARQHTDNVSVLGLPPLCLAVLGVTEIGGVAAPQPAFFRRSQRHDHIAPKFGIRPGLPSAAFDQQRAHRLDARRSWPAMPPYCSILGNCRLARWISMERSYARRNTSNDQTSDDIHKLALCSDD